jgi:hypothetical protein
LRDRESAIDYANKKGVPVDQSKKKIYSRDRNLWHISHEGADLESPANEPKDDLWVMSVPVSKAPNEPEYVTIDFERGNPVAVNGKKLPGHELIATLNEIGGKHAVGQTQLAENRLVGMKSRGAYETPGGTILYEAHKALEQICIERDTFHYKQQVASNMPNWSTTASGSIRCARRCSRSSITRRRGDRAGEGEAIQRPRDGGGRHQPVQPVRSATGQLQHGRLRRDGGARVHRFVRLADEGGAARRRGGRLNDEDAARVAETREREAIGARCKP